MKSSNRILLHQILLFAGCFAITYNIAIAFHELGHVLAYSMVDEDMSEFVLNPFSWSWATSKNLNVFVLWGGVTFGQLFALIPLAFTWKLKSDLFVFLSKMLAASAFLINGIYLTLGAVLHFGDGGSLVYVGYKTSGIVVFGSVYFLISFLLWSDLQGHLGMNRKTKLWDRMKIMTGGIAPYMILIIIYNLLHNADQMVMWGGLGVFGILVSFVIAFGGHGWARLFQIQGKKVVAPHYSWKLVSFGLIIIIVEFIIFGTPPNPF